MIVALAAWLYIIQALLGLASLFSGPFGFGGGSGTFASLIVSGVFGAMGYGLLKREPWARWLALGVSLLSWVFGSLMLIGLIGALALSGKSGAFIGMMLSGAFVIVAVIMVIAIIIMIVSVVISFKLFFHLCSEDGCDEFGVPYGSTRTVLMSVGAWLALMFGQVFMTAGSGGFATLLARQAMAGNHRGDEQESARQRLESQREYQRQAEERVRRAEQEARLRAIRDAENAPATEPAPVTTEPADVEPRYSTLAADTAPPVANQPHEEEEKTSASTILKCRDASGSVMFTQGYCPPGSQRVDMSHNQ